MSRKLYLTPINAKNVVMACCILHNMLRDQISARDVDSYAEDGTLNDGRWRRLQSELNLVNLEVGRGSGHSTDAAKRLRVQVAQHLYNNREVLRSRRNRSREQN